MDATRLQQILDYLCDELGGDWLIVGGALVRLLFDGTRGTEDLDLVRLNHPNLSDEGAKAHLFRWLIQNGLGPEWVNSAVEPFVREVTTWQSEIVLVRTGSKGKIFRPTLTLFVYLKLRRATDVDLLDIKKAIPKCPEGFDEKKFALWADQKLNSRLELFKRHHAF